MQSGEAILWPLPGNHFLSIHHLDYKWNSLFYNCHTFWVLQAAGLQLARWHPQDLPHPLLQPPHACLHPLHLCSQQKVVQKWQWFWAYTVKSKTKLQQSKITQEMNLIWRLKGGGEFYPNCRCCWRWRWPKRRWWWSPRSFYKIYVINFCCKCFQLGQGQSQVTIWTSLNNIQTCYIYNWNVSWNWIIECLYFSLIFVPNCLSIWKIKMKWISAIKTKNSTQPQTVVADDDKDDLNENIDYCHAACTEEGGMNEKGDARHWDSIVASCAELARIPPKKNKNM